MLQYLLVERSDYHKKLSFKFIKTTTNFYSLIFTFNIFIYSNSMQNGNTSSNASQDFVGYFNNINLFENKIYLFIENIFIKLLDLNKNEAKEIVIRKIAHIT